MTMTYDVMGNNGNGQAGRNTAIQIVFVIKLRCIPISIVVLDVAMFRMQCLVTATPTRVRTFLVSCCLLAASPGAARRGHGPVVTSQPLRN